MSDDAKLTNVTIHYTNVYCEYEMTIDGDKVVLNAVFNADADIKMEQLNEKITSRTYSDKMDETKKDKIIQRIGYIFSLMGPLLVRSMKQLVVGEKPSEGLKQGILNCIHRFPCTFQLKDDHHYLVYGGAGHQPWIRKDSSLPTFYL